MTKYVLLYLNLNSMSKPNVPRGAKYGQMTGEVALLPLPGVDWNGDNANGDAGDQHEYQTDSLNWKLHQNEAIQAYQKPVADVAIAVAGCQSEQFVVHLW